MTMMRIKKKKSRQRSKCYLRILEKVWYRAVGYVQCQYLPIQYRYRTIVQYNWIRLICTTHVSSNEKPNRHRMFRNRRNHRPPLVFYVRRTYVVSVWLNVTVDLIVKILWDITVRNSTVTYLYFETNEYIVDTVAVLVL